MRKTVVCIIIILGLLITFPLSAREDIPQVTAEGLHLVPDTHLRLVYADPDADLAVYSSLLLIDSRVTSGRSEG